MTVEPGSVRGPYHLLEHIGSGGMGEVWKAIDSRLGRTVAIKLLKGEHLVATRIRHLGLQRILYGSDAAVRGNLPPKEGWEAFRSLPLSEEEFRTIAGNVPPYFR